MSPAMQELSQVILRAIRKVADPQLVILFGSQARGDANATSDIDLLLVEDRTMWKSPTRRQEIGRLRRALPRLGRPVDLLLFTPAEVNQWRSAQNHIISQALAHGDVVYERH